MVRSRESGVQCRRPRLRAESIAPRLKRVGDRTGSHNGPARGRTPPVAGKKKKSSGLPPGVKLVADNRKARFDYEIVDKVEAGLQLKGSEVKSLREGKVIMGDAYAAIDGGEAYLHSLHIPEYVHGAYANHDPIRVRKLLLHKEEITKLYDRVREKGMTLVPLQLYFKKGRAKLQVGLAKGRARHDKRHAIRDRDEKRARERDED